MKPHAFVAMPFGTKPGHDGVPVDFNRVFAELLEPAIAAAGLTVLRADQEQRAGDIRTDMFQELLMADLVVADLTIDNPNVWYELGVRHALRSRGVVLVAGGRSPTAFDLYTDRKLRYALKDGAPDPDTLDADRDRLTAMVRATMASWHGRPVSPVYALMPHLREPDWREMRIGQVKAFWDLHDAWEDRIDLARKTGRIGDILVLAEEAPVTAFRAEAWIKAGEALRRAEKFDFALEQLDRGLAVEPVHRKGLQEKGICLQRLAQAGVPGHSIDRARAHYREMLALTDTLGRPLYAEDAESWALLGRVEKDTWIEAWRAPDKSPVQMREDAAYEDALLRAAIENYLRGYRCEVGHYFSGINALTLMHLHAHLTGDTRYAATAASMAGAVRFAAQCDAHAGGYWAAVTQADLELLDGSPETVTAAYKEAVARDDKDWFSLNSTRAQLALLASLGFRPEAVSAAQAVFERALARMRRPETQWQPRNVFLFSGHMVDAPDRAAPRFPEDKVPAAAARIAAALDDMGAGPEDLAVSQAAAGGDLLFLEAALARGLRAQVMLPFDEPEFIARSVLPSRGGDAWRDRYFAVRGASGVSVRVMDDDLGPAPAGTDPFERCNLWLLYTALACGIDKVRFVCLWNGGGGDGPGGTAHMYEEVKRRTGRVEWIDTRAL